MSPREAKLYAWHSPVTNALEQCFQIFLPLRNAATGRVQNRVPCRGNGGIRVRALPGAPSQVEGPGCGWCKRVRGTAPDCAGGGAAWRSAWGSRSLCRGL